MSGGIAKGAAPGKGKPRLYRAARALNESRPVALYAPALLAGSGQVRVIIAVLAGVIAVATLALLMGYPLDLAVAQFLYDPASKKFLAEFDPAIGKLRDNGLVAIVTCAGFVVTAVVNRL